MIPRPTLRPAARRAARPAARPRTRAAAVEHLEDRLLLTIYTVDTALDVSAVDGQTSLREALIAAESNAAFGDAPAGEADGDLILFADGVDAVALTSALPALTDDLRIDGGGGVTIVGAAGEAIFESLGTEEFAFSDLTLASGSADRGGAMTVENGAAVALNEVRFDGNFATGDEGGGAIYATGGSRLIVAGGEFLNNAAVEGDSGSGGAVFLSDATAAFDGTLFNNNTAARAGGAIETEGGSTLILNDARFTRNAATGGDDGEGDGDGPGNGGAVHVTGGDAVTAVDGGTFALNTAANQGGALWNADDSDLTVTGVTFSTNTASGSDTASGDDPGDGGGAIYDQGDGDVTVEDSVFFLNSADGEGAGGGAILSVGGNLTVTDSTFNMNASVGDGAAVHMDTGRVVFEDARFTRNMAGEEDSGDGCGGAIYNDADAVVTVTGGIIADNFAALEGGGVWNSDSGVMVLSDLSLARNEAAGDDADQGGGGVYNENDLRLNDVFVDRNRATGESGSGGGILSLSGTVVVDDSNLNANTANRAGGGIELVDGDLRFRNSFLRNNIAGGGGEANPGNGGGYHVSGDALAVFVSSGVSGNSAANEGGGLWNQDDARLVLRDTDVRDNGAETGGGIYNNGGRVDLRRDSRLIRNSTSGDGAGLFNAGDGAAYLQDATFARGEAGGTGGGVFTESDAETFLRDAMFADNDPNDIAGPGAYRGSRAGLTRGGGTDGGGTDGGGTDGGGGEQGRGGLA